MQHGERAQFIFALTRRGQCALLFALIRRAQRDHFMFVDAARTSRVARLLHRDQFRAGAGRIICARLLLIGGKLRAIKMKARSATKTLKVLGIFLNGSGPARGTTIVFQRAARQDSFNACECFTKEHHERQT